MRRACLVLSVAALWQSGVTPTFADTGLYALVDTTRDNNLFRLSDSTNTRAAIGTDERSDTFTRGELGINSDLNVGRQHFNVTANANRTMFNRYSFLDNTGGAANALWDWTVGNQWQGNLGYQYNRSLASFELQGAGQDRRTQVTEFANAFYRLHPSWRTHVAVDRTNTDYSLASAASLEFEGRSGEIGLQYIAPSENNVGIRLRTTRGDLPNRQIVNGVAVDNSYDQTETGFTFEWRIAGHSRLYGGVDHTRREHEQFPARDFSGTTGRLNFDWNETDRVTWRIAAWRRLTESDNDLTATYTVSDGVLLSPTWAISNKVRLEATAMRIKRDFRGDPQVLLLVLTDRQDVARSGRLGLSYLLAPKFGFNVGYAVEKRSSNVALADYDDRIIDAGVRVEF